MANKILSPETRNRLSHLVATDGETAIAERLGIHRQTLARLVAGFAVHAATAGYVTATFAATKGGAQ